MKIKSEKGVALPLVMIAVLIGALLIPPFLGHTSSSLIGSRVYGQSIGSQYGADAGAEQAIWNLTNGGITGSLPTPGSEISYTLPESVNGLATNVKICNSWETIASDNLESGGWTGGSGWLNNWTNSGDSGVVTTGAPYEGTYHLRLRTDVGSVSRSVDLSKQVSAHLRFWAKVNSFETGETATCDVTSDGTNWTTAHTFTTADDDNTYHYYDIDLTAYNLTSQFRIAFNAHMSGTGDYFYVDKLEIIWLAVAPQTVASDDFESGGWTGGSGWSDNWTYAGEAAVVTNAGPYGTYHLRLRNSTGAVSRSADVANAFITHLQFWAKVNSFESGDTAVCQVSSDNISWTTVHTWTSSDSDNTYHYYDIDLSTYQLTSRFWIAFNAHMNANNDYLYIDDLAIVNMHGFGITSSAGDRLVKAVVDIVGGQLTVLSWYYK